MFGGLIQDTATILSYEKLADRLQISLKLDFKLEQGESLAINGTCLTVSDIKNDVYFFDICPESLLRTTFNYLKCNDVVHVERALKFQDRLSGHVLSGHIDYVASVIKSSKIEEQVKLYLSCSSEFIQFIMLRSYIAIDGVSLTITDVTEDSFAISLIPETLKQTQLFKLKEGSKVNVEIDNSMRYFHDTSGIFSCKVSQDVTKSIDELLLSGGVVLIEDSNNYQAALMASCKISQENLMFIYSFIRSPLMVACSALKAEQLALPAPIINAKTKQERRYLIPVSHYKNDANDYSSKALLKSLTLFSNNDMSMNHWQTPGNISSVEVLGYESDTPKGIYEYAVEKMYQLDKQEAAICSLLFDNKGNAFSPMQSEIFAKRFSIPKVNINELL